MQRQPLISRRPPPRHVALILLVALLLLSIAASYPVITEIVEDENRCIRFNIPETDDAHVIILALPNSGQIMDESVESWYVQQVYKMSQMRKQQDRRGAIPSHLPDDAPSNVAQAMSKFLQTHVSGGSMAPIKITLGVESLEEKRYTTTYRAKYFQPVVINHVRKHHAAKISENFEGVQLCFKNEHEEETIHVVFDKILDSEEIDESVFMEEGKSADGANQAARFNKEKHLNPLETSLNRCIVAAQNVLREMRYMESRENRMRKTADSINARVRWFSYLSVIVLLSVTYIQVTYLKRYFHKKKIL
jgi:p24 family protein delta-1